MGRDYNADFSFPYKKHGDEVIWSECKLEKGSIEQRNFQPNLTYEIQLLHQWVSIHEHLNYS